MYGEQLDLAPRDGNLAPGHEWNKAVDAWCRPIPECAKAKTL